MSWSTSELRARFAPLNRFKPSSKILYWPFQGGTSFVDLLYFCSVLCLLCFCARLFICALWSPAGKGLTSWLSFVVSAESLSLSHWYPGSGVVLDCIDSWSLHPYLLYLYIDSITNEIIQNDKKYKFTPNVSPEELETLKQLWYDNTIIIKSNSLLPLLRPKTKQSILLSSICMPVAMETAYEHFG